MKQLILILLLISTGLAKQRIRRLAGGQNASPGQFPYQVSLQLHENNRYFCSGSILSEHFILTAAHCIRQKNAKDIVILVGTHTHSKGGTKYRVDKMTMHPEYDLITKIHDIALLKVEKNITFNNFTQPIPLVTNKTQIPCNANLTVSGWGSIGKGKINGSDTIFNIYKDNLQFFEVTQISPRICDLIYSNLGGAKDMIISDTEFCTLAKSGMGVCDGDSGSPAVYNGMLVGVATWKTICAIGVPDGYSNVSSYITWINDTMNEMDNFTDEIYRR